MSTQRKVVYKGTGIDWYAMPNAIIGSVTHPGVFFDLSLREHRLLGLIQFLAGRDGSRTVELSNRDAMHFTKLDGDSLPIVRRELFNRRLIRFEKSDRRGERYMYEIADPLTGWSLTDGSDGIEDDWGQAA